MIFDPRNKQSTLMYLQKKTRKAKVADVVTPGTGTGTCLFTVRVRRNLQLSKPQKNRHE